MKYSQAFFDFQDIKSLTHKVYFAEKVGVTKRKSCGGPLCPKSAMVIKFPSLQHLHFLWKVEVLVLESGKILMPAVCLRKNLFNIDQVKFFTPKLARAEFCWVLNSGNSQ